MRTRLIVTLLVAGAATAFGQVNPVKLAATARFDLSASVETGAIANGQWVAGGGWFGRQTWLPADEQPRTYTVSPNVTRFGWSAIAFRFIPASNGVVTCRLLGPWEQSGTGGPIYRQEVLWDALSATNTTLTNGSFELLSGSLPVGWSRPYGDAVVETGPTTPQDGSRYARVWHDGPLACSVVVTGGLPVTLSFFARSYVPPGYPDMARITDPNSAGHRAARQFMRGVNLGNYLEAPPNSWGTLVPTLADLDHIRGEGFDHIRLPVGWQYYTGSGPGFTISNVVFEKVDFVVTNALDRGLGVLVNIHHFDDFTTDPAGQGDRFYAIWEQVAAHYADQPAGLAFELLNEPRDNATTTVINPIYAEAIRRIRLTNPDRTIFVGPGSFNSMDQLPNLLLPDADSNLVVTVHCYDPFLFTHQGASWTLPSTATRGVVYPGPPTTPIVPNDAVTNLAWVMQWFADYNALPATANPSSRVAYEARFQQAKQWSDYYGRPVHVGEFGAYEMADPASRVRFYAEIRATIERLGFGWAMWDWKAGFRYWQENTGAPYPGMPGAMFPAPVLQSTGSGQIAFEAATAKRYRVDKALAIRVPMTWTPIMTQTVARPWFEYADPDTNAAVGFYRVEWLK